MRGGGFGARVRRERIKRALTVEELAARAKVSTGHLSRIETEQSVPAVDLAKNIAAALGVSLDSLVDAGARR